MTGQNGANKYSEVNLDGDSRAVLGNHYGDAYHIQSATFRTPSPTSDSDDSTYTTKRRNRVFSTHTLETITKFSESGPPNSRGDTIEKQLRWESRNFLGAGIFAEVHREEQDSDQTAPRNRAVKVLRRKQLEACKIKYKRELEALIYLSQPHYHRHFVEFYSWYENDQNVFLAMEYIPLGDLGSLIEDKVLKVRDVQEICHQILDGIRIMHRLDFVHRDIKAKNIFVVSKDPWWVKIGDFSISKSTTSKHTGLYTKFGPNGYQAPEVSGFVEWEKKDRYNEKCDIWSYACLMYEMLTGRLPFDPHEPSELINYCFDASGFPSDPLCHGGVTVEASTVLQQLLIARPELRPDAESAAKICQPWFRMDYSMSSSAATENAAVPSESEHAHSCQDTSPTCVEKDTDGPLDARTQLPESDAAHVSGCVGNPPVLVGFVETAVEPGKTERGKEADKPSSMSGTSRTTVETTSMPTRQPGNITMTSRNLQHSSQSLPSSARQSQPQKLTAMDSPIVPNRQSQNGRGWSASSDMLPQTIEQKANLNPTEQVSEVIHFTDALGRYYKFPWSRCRTWADMENLIQRAFAHIDKIGPCVSKGRYDLIGPDKTHIMSEYWEDAIEPGMAISMTLWPLAESEPTRRIVQNPESTPSRSQRDTTNVGATPNSAGRPKSPAKRTKYTAVSPMQTHGSRPSGRRKHRD